MANHADGAVDKVVAVDKVCDAIRLGIGKGIYPAGSRLGEADLAESLAVSRTPVREALRRLSSEGLIETLPNRGARVRSWSETEIVEVFELRALLEGRAANLAARNATPDLVAALDALCTGMEVAAASHNLVEVANLNRRFHLHLAGMANSPLLSEMIASVSLLALALRTFEGYGQARLEQSLRQHRELVNAISASDSMWAESVMRSHILSATHVLTGLLRGEEKPPVDTIHRPEK